MPIPNYARCKCGAALQWNWRMVMYFNPETQKFHKEDDNYVWAGHESCPVSTTVCGECGALLTTICGYHGDVLNHQPQLDNVDWEVAPNCDPQN